MNKQQQQNLNDIWDSLKKNEHDSYGLVHSTIIQDDQNGQTMLLPLDTPPGGNIKVSRLSAEKEWHLA